MYKQNLKSRNPILLQNLRNLHKYLQWLYFCTKFKVLFDEKFYNCLLLIMYYIYYRILSVWSFAFYYLSLSINQSVWECWNNIISNFRLSLYKFPIILIFYLIFSKRWNKTLLERANAATKQELFGAQWLSDLFGAGIISHFSWNLKCVERLNVALFIVPNKIVGHLGCFTICGIRLLHQGKLNQVLLDM